MATIRVGYAGRDVRGRPCGPLSRDIGPAAAHATGLSAIGAVSLGSLTDRDAVAQGAGPIERRQLTPDELAARLGVDRAKEMTVTAPAPAASLPCDDCLHAMVCRLRDGLLEFLAEPVPSQPLPGIRVRPTGWDVECEHHLARPTPAPRLATHTPEALARAIASRQRGNEAMLAKKAAAKESAARRSLSPEGRERIRQSAIAMQARRRAEREAS